MGECGCASETPEYRLLGSDGFHYGIEIYTGCRDCHTPVMLAIHRWDDELAQMFLDGQAIELPIVTYSGDENGSGTFTLPLLDPGVLLEELRKETDSLDDEPSLRRCVEAAMRRTREMWRGQP